LPEEVVLPKLSQLTRVLAGPEEQFESAVEKATGVKLPPGPQTVLLGVQESIEARKAPALPEIEFPELPELPGVEGGRKFREEPAGKRRPKARRVFLEGP